MFPLTNFPNDKQVQYKFFRNYFSENKHTLSFFILIIVLTKIPLTFHLIIIIPSIYSHPFFICSRSSPLPFSIHRQYFHHHHQHRFQQQLQHRFQFRCRVGRSLLCTRTISKVRHGSCCGCSLFSGRRDLLHRIYFRKGG